MALKAKLVEAKLRELSGNVAAVARVFGVTRQSMAGYIKRRPALAAVALECREAMKDNVESVLYSSALKGLGWAVIFYLKTQARDRGYTERHDLGELAAELAELRKLVEGQPDVCGGAAAGAAQPQGAGGGAAGGPGAGPAGSLP
jgi:hypothetical protein